MFSSCSYAIFINALTCAHCAHCAPPIVLLLTALPLRRISKWNSGHVSQWRRTLSNCCWESFLLLETWPFVMHWPASSVLHELLVPCTKSRTPSTFMISSLSKRVRRGLEKQFCRVFNGRFFSVWHNWHVGLSSTEVSEQKINKSEIKCDSNSM